MAQNIAELNVAIEYCKFDFAYMEAEFKNGFPPGSLNYEMALDLAMENFKYAHQHFESLCNDQPLIFATVTAMDELITELNSANERCKNDFAILEEAYFDVVIQYGLVDLYQNWVLVIAMGNLRRAHWYLEWECDNAIQYLMTAGQGQGQQVGPNANAVVANVSDEHNTGAIPSPQGTAREEMVEGNSITSDQLALYPNKKLRLN